MGDSKRGLAWAALLVIIPAAYIGFFWVLPINCPLMDTWSWWANVLLQHGIVALVWGFVLTIVWAFDTIFSSY